MKLSHTNTHNNPKDLNVSSSRCGTARDDARIEVLLGANDGAVSGSPAKSFAVRTV